ncbi:eRF1 domain 1 domain-containing protein [Ditylenchus destructor]|nr:eRF1 domain 1 domain-containing protein [Ditylenchus destructor]
MKILRRYLEKDSSGYVKLICEEDEDMWHIYNLVRVGDTVRCSTFRKVMTESATGSKSSQRIQTTLTIVVETIHFDPTVCTLHLKGRNAQENAHVKLGAYHTLDLELNRPFTLEKPCWDTMDLHRLELCADLSNTADVAAVIMHEGFANLCLLSSSMTVTKAKIDMQIARKRKGLTHQHEKSMQNFFTAIATAFVRHVNIDAIKCVIVASPGFLKEQFLEFLMEYAEKEGLKNLIAQKGKFLLAHSSSGFKHALKEVLTDPTVANKLSDTKAQAEVKALNTFLELMSTNPDKAVYGYAHVKLAIKEMAIDTLMVSDSLFRSKNIGQRRKYVQLVEIVREQVATVLIFSSMHVTGERLTQLTGVAAILRYPIPGIDDEELWNDEETLNDEFAQNGHNAS